MSSQKRKCNPSDNNNNIQSTSASNSNNSQAILATVLSNFLNSNNSSSCDLSSQLLGNLRLNSQPNSACASNSTSNKNSACSSKRNSACTSKRNSDSEDTDSEENIAKKKKFCNNKKTALMDISNDFKNVGNKKTCKYCDFVSKKYFKHILS